MKIIFNYWRCKMKRTMTLFGLTFMFIGTVWADRRSYVWTYEYLTVPQGETELEYYFTLQNKDGSNFRATTNFQQWIELEHGLTDHWDISLYQMFVQEPYEHLKYEGFKLRTRYRFSERGGLPVDPLIYLEYIRFFEELEDKIEAKLILARDIWKINISLNLVGELEKKGGEEWEDEEKALIGVSFEPTPAMKLGGEYEVSEHKAYLGPTVSFASGENWITLGAKWGLTERARDLDVRLLIGIGL
jgi:hypothetical protein